MNSKVAADSSSDQNPILQVSSALFSMRGWRKWLLLLTGWSLLGLAQAPRQWAIYFSDGIPLVPWRQAAMWAMGEWYIWGLLSLLIVRVTAWISVDRKTWVRAGLIHLGLGILIGLIHIFLYSMILVGLRVIYDLQVGMSFDSIWPWFTGAIWTRLHASVLTYFLIAFVCYAIRYYRRYRDEQQRLVAAEGQLSEARLEALKMQLHPHFLFNTLNAITALIHTEPEIADQMTTRLSDLLRVTLDSESVQEVSLRKELAFLDGYLEIQQLRFQDRLIVNRDIAGDTLDAMVPNLILQPLVENAVQHGVSRGSGQGEITITAHQTDGLLRVCVSDNGPGLNGDPNSDNSNGLGLANTRERLKQLYGNRQSVQFENSDRQGLRVIISLPFRIESPPLAESDQP